MDESAWPSSARTQKGARMGGARGKPSRLDARARVFAVLAQAGAVSRAELARRTRLAASTVGAAVSELEAQGLVTEPAAPAEQPARVAMGRPPVLVALHR